MQLGNLNMTCFKRKIFNTKFKMLIVHAVLFVLILFFFSCSVIKNDFFSTKSAVIAAIVFLTLEQIFDNFLFHKKLNVNDDEFLRYKYCKTGNTCNCHIDSLLEIIFKFSPDLITFKDTKLRYAMCSKLFLDVFGYNSSQEVIGKTPEDIFPAENSKQINMYLELVLKERIPQSYVLQFDLKNGSRVRYELISAPIVSNDEVVGILTLSRDVTEIYNLKESLEFSNSKLYALINNSPMLTYVQDIEGNFVLGNQRAREFFLTGVDFTMEGEKIKFDMDMMKPDIIEENAKVLNSGTSFQIEKRLLAENGEKYWYRIHKTPMKNGEGKVYAITTFARNIDAEKRIGEERETYIATLSHDLKTPTIAQVRALQLLLSGQLGDLNPDQKEMLKLTLDSCNYMYDMVYTLLSTYKFENGDISLTYSSFDLVSMISDSINEISNLAAENSIKIEFVPQDNVCKVCADKIELKRVIINLLSNAINYAYSSTVVYVGLSISNGNVEVRVQNSSAYIEPEVMSNLFRKYVTHSEKYNKVGIGLGLYLSKKIIGAHQGKIIAESSPSHHNTFGFSIPISCGKAVCNCDTAEVL